MIGADEVPPADRTPEGYRIESCRSCDARIIWATTAGKKAMPVDAEPVDDGNVELVLNGSLAVSPVAIVHGQRSMLYDGPLRKSHFATCPDHDRWRRK